VEAAPGVTQYRELLHDIMTEPGYKGRHVRLHTLKAEQRKKEHRIYGLMQLWERMKFKIHAGMYPSHRLLWMRQMQAYPVGHDDLLDCASYLQDCRRFRPPKPKREPTPEQAERKRRALKTVELMDDYYADRRGRQRMGIVGGLPEFM
jgi:hypothetical protein